MPDWTWKFASLFASLCILPLTGWIWSTQQTLSTQTLELTHLKDRLEEKTEMITLENQEQQQMIVSIEQDMDAIDSMQIDVAVIKNQIEQMSLGIDEIKFSLRK